MSRCKIDCDFHTHTGFSDDCDVSFDDMLAGAAAAGIKILAVTDHHDPGYPDPEYPFQLDFPAYHRALETAREKYEGVMDIRRGVEMGIWEGFLDEASRHVNGYDYDFVIGSFHCMRVDDLVRYDFASSDGPAELEDFYRFMYECLSKYSDYDILGHFSVIDRYIGRLYDYGPVTDIIDEILRLIIGQGKGIELNTSSFKYGTGTWLPREQILRRYLELGGEILTFGSDAHDPKYYQYHFDDALEFAGSLGFRHYCTFAERKPEFHRLP